MKMFCIGEENLVISPDDEMKVKYYILEENKTFFQNLGFTLSTIPFQN